MILRAEETADDSPIAQMLYIDLDPEPNTTISHQQGHAGCLSVAVRLAGAFDEGPML